MPIQHPDDDAQPFFRALDWESSEPPAPAPAPALAPVPINQSEPLSPLTSPDQSGQLNPLGSINANIDVTMSSESKKSTNTADDQPSRPHATRINSIRWLLGSPNAVRRMSAAYITQDQYGLPVLHLQHQISPASSVTEHSTDDADTLRSAGLGQENLDNDQDRGRSRNRLSVGNKEHHQSRKQEVVSTHSNTYTQMSINPPQQLAVPPPTVSSMDLITQIHDICVRATRSYLLDRLVSAYVRDPRTCMPYSQRQRRRSLSPGRIPGSPQWQSINARDRYRQREAPEFADRAFISATHSGTFGASSPTRWHRRTSSESRPGAVSYNLATNISSICTLAWSQAARARLHEPQAERLAVDNMAALLEWSDRIVLAERDIWRGRSELDSQTEANLHDPERTIVGNHVGSSQVSCNNGHDYEIALREMEWRIVLGVAAAAANICVYMDDWQARGAIEALLM
ncbi:hypothetical protein CFIMG_007449RA00001 [Ceratocystis fimbriata CBS 114723]|uniref:Uncharacterized protein n=1 Tax=Ceratocystis fimbriata CBS 114723 TaxID=1035309 RepID=A0A2C5WX40_9PEZI|nr:hypothetical protein CFIMG_007449RA00001 [Ceratocystis fimbriata CBS 114723]